MYPKVEYNKFAQMSTSKIKQHHRKEQSNNDYLDLMGAPKRYN